MASGNIQSYMKARSGPGKSFYPPGNIISQSQAVAICDSTKRCVHMRHSLTTIPGQGDAMEDPSEIVPAYVEPMRRQLHDRLEKKDFYGAVCMMGGIEKNIAKDYALSRIGAKTESWKPHAQLLLYSADTRVLCAAIDGTLPQRALWDLRSAVRKPAVGTDTKAWFGKKDPGVYLNFLADMFGKGLSDEEILEFAKVLAIAAGLEDDTDGKYPNLRDELNQIWNQLRGAGPDRSTWPDFWSSFNTESLRTIVRCLVDHYRWKVVPAARAAGIDNIMLKAECGFSIKCFDRCADHVRLDDTSPAGFRLSRLVLVFLFPGRGFDKLHQFIIFDVLSAEAAGIGECIGHVMSGAYESQGGFNIAQAGLSVAGAWKLSQHELKETRNQMLERGVFKRIDANAAVAQKMLDTELERLHRTQRQYLLEQELATEKEGLEQSLPLLAAKMGGAEAAIGTAMAAAENLERVALQRQRDDEQVQVARHAIREFAGAAIGPVVALAELPESATPQGQRNDEQAQIARDAIREFAEGVFGKFPLDL
ncbi:hypothetical protein LTR27_011155 [Elasticomyces elasticus]|nr:hypothetical protein LTR27_011155 [Elasticomyces elasticus]